MRVEVEFASSFEEGVTDVVRLSTLDYFVSGIDVGQRVWDDRQCVDRAWSIVKCKIESVVEGIELNFFGPFDGSTFVVSIVGQFDAWTQPWALELTQKILTSAGDTLRMLERHGMPVV